MHDFVLASLQSAKGRWTEVASGSGVSKRTLEKIARREIEDPGISHVEKLALYFEWPGFPRRARMKAVSANR